MTKKYGGYTAAELRDTVLTTERRNALGSLITNWLSEQDEDGRMLDTFDYFDVDKIDALIDEAIAPAIADAVTCATAALSAPAEATQAGAVPAGWISAADRLPKAGKAVLVAFKNSLGNWRTTRAIHAPKFTIPNDHWDNPEDGDEDETGEFWVPEGWHEDPVEAECGTTISEIVTHWMPLPPAPDAAPQAPVADAARAEPAELKRIGYATLHGETIISVRLDDSTPTDFIDGYSGRDVFVIVAPTQQPARASGSASVITIPVELRDEEAHEALAIALDLPDDCDINMVDVWNAVVEVAQRFNLCAPIAAQQPARASEAGEAVAWRHRDNHTVISDKQRHDMVAYNGIPGKRIAEEYSIPLVIAPAQQAVTKECD